MRVGGADKRGGDGFRALWWSAVGLVVGLEVHWEGFGEGVALVDTLPRLVGCLGARESLFWVWGWRMR